MSPDGWFSPQPAPSIPTQPLMISPPPVIEADDVTVPEATPEEPPTIEATIEAEVIDAEVEPAPPPVAPPPPSAPAPSAPRAPVPMDQAMASASEGDRLNLAKHRAQADL